MIVADGDTRSVVTETRTFRGGPLGAAGGIASKCNTLRAHEILATIFTRYYYVPSCGIRRVSAGENGPAAIVTMATLNR